MGYLAKQSFEVWEINEEEAIDVTEQEEDSHESFQSPMIWNRLKSIYDVVVFKNSTYFFL